MQTQQEFICVTDTNGNEFLTPAGFWRMFRTYETQGENGRVVLGYVNTTGFREWRYAHDLLVLAGVPPGYDESPEDRRGFNLCFMLKKVVFGVQSYDAT